MSTSTIGLVLLLGVLTFILLLFRLRKRSAAGLSRYLERQGFTARGEAVPHAFLAEDMHGVEVFSGPLRPALEAQLLFGRRQGGSVMINNVPVIEIEEYLAIHVPAPRPVPDRDWMARWAADPHSRGARPQRVTLTLQGGVLFNWRCPLSAKTVAERLDAVRAAWPKTAEGGAGGHVPCHDP
jgi:hypothetical protein